LKSQKSGKRHPLLFYRRTMDRLWKATLALGLLLFAAGIWRLVSETSILLVSSKIWLYAAAILAITMSVFAFVGRYFAYVQVHRNYLSIVTPFLRLRISFQRLRNSHPSLLRQLFPKDDSSWAQQRYLEPFYGKTAVVLELRDYPMAPALLKLFLPGEMFSPRTPGFILLVPNWMQLSLELDSFYGIWRQLQNQRIRNPRNY